MNRYALPLLLLAAVACADGSRPVAAPATTPPPVTAPVAAPVTASPAAARATTPPPASQPASQPAAAFVEPVYFRSPSGNVGCAIEGNAAVCDIFEKRWTPTAKPATCEYDWGLGMYVPNNPPAKARFSCASDTVHNPSSPVLAYGESVSGNGFRCESRRDAMRCVHVASGHGFDVSRDRYRLY